MISDKARKLAHAYAREAPHPRGTVAYKARYEHFLRAWEVAYPEGVKHGERNVERVRGLAMSAARKNEKSIAWRDRLIADLRMKNRQLKARLKSRKRRQS